MMNVSFSIRNKLGGIFGRQSRDEMVAELVKAQAIGASVSALTMSREWPVMEQIIRDFRDKAVAGLAAKDISKEEAQRLTNRMEQLHDIEHRLAAKIKSGEVAAAKLKRIEEKQNG